MAIDEGLTMTRNMSGKVVAITGAAHGLGKAFAERIASSGGTVALIDIDTEGAEAAAAAIRERGGDAAAFTGDVAHRGSITAAIDTSVERFGKLTGLVNNAGLIHITRCGFEDVPEEEWDRVFNVNLKGTWHTSIAAAPHLRANGSGSIVNLTSSMVYRGGPLRAHYVASKAAIQGLTRVMAKELGAEWIRVNAVCPGSVLTEEDPDDEILAWRGSAAGIRVLARMSVPGDIAGPVEFLLSDDSEFITGQTLLVEGGGIFT